MTLRLTSTRPRTLATLATFALATSGVVAVNSPADALPIAPATIDVATAAEYIAALDAASSDDTQAHTIRVTEPISLVEDDEAVYWGTTDLAIDGGGNTITGPGDISWQGGAPFEHVFLGVVPASALGQQGNGSQEFAPNITVKNVTVSEFMASGAVYSQTEGLFRMEDVNFSFNASYLGVQGNSFYQGAAVLNALGDISVTDSTFEDNAGFLGGVLSNNVYYGQEPPTITVSGSTFSDNSALAGAAILAQGQLDVSGSAFERNSGMSGGAITSVTRASIVGSTFTDNEAVEYGEFDPNPTDGLSGAAVLAAGTLDIRDSTFTGNHSEDGGAVALHPTVVGKPNGSPKPPLVLTVSGSTFDNNSAESSAGAIEAGNPHGNAQGTTLTVDIENSTFTANSSSVAQVPGAGAIVLAEVDGTDLTLTNTTFAHNSGPDAAHVFAGFLNDGDHTALTGNAFVGEQQQGCEFLEPIGVASGNFDTDGTCTNDWSDDGNIGENQDPMLGPLADNGGATRTMLPADGSPLLDANALIDGACGVDRDQRGVVRPQGDACDIGSVEVEVAVVVVPVPPVPECTDVPFQIKTDKGMITAVAHCATAVSNVKWTAAADVTSTAPAGLVLPLGIASFDVAVATAGDSVTIDLTLPLAVTQFWKITDGGWAQVDGATIDSAGTGITYTLTDGGIGDEDGTANAVIVDPIAPAVGAAFTG